MENFTNNQPLSRVEAVVASMNDSVVELQIAGSYETFQWPRNLLSNAIAVGEKILLELKNHPLTSIQKTVEKAKNSQENKNTDQQRKLLESLIN